MSRTLRGCLSPMADGQKKVELTLYAVLWLVLFMAPILNEYLSVHYMTLSVAGHPAAESFSWKRVEETWGLLAMFLVLFAVHNFVLAPQLVYRGRRLLYGMSVAALLVAFAFLQHEERQAWPHDGEDRHHGEEMMYGRRTGHGMPDGMEARPLPPPEHGTDAAFRPEPPRRDDGHGGGEPRQALGGPDTVAVIIATLLLGLNVGTKYFFKSMDDRKRMKELERENLNNQLKYLKYQINPHFFMNTLNNIHALVDIDPEEAKRTIEVLSKLMRYVLYEGNSSMAPLPKELEFLNHYIDLMRIRYTDRVRISVSFPETAPNVQVPSLLFATFVENAFKHGVSYQKDSFIDVGVRVDAEAEKLEFVCSNSVKPSSEDHHGGVGLENAVRRLQLIYGRRYSMQVEAGAECYSVRLVLPVAAVR